MIWALVNDLGQRVLTLNKDEQRRQLRRRLEALALRPGSKALDFGCGTGLFAGTFGERGLTYHGYDIDDRMVAYARRMHPGHIFASTREAVARHGPFNLVVANCCFHHISDDVLAEDLEWVKAVLADRGTFLLIDLVLHIKDPSLLRRAYCMLERGRVRPPCRGIRRDRRPPPGGQARERGPLPRAVHSRQSRLQRPRGRRMREIAGPSRLGPVAPYWLGVTGRCIFFVIYGAWIAQRLVTWTDESAYVHFGYLAASGRISLFQDEMTGSRMPLPFWINGWSQVVFGRSLLAARLVSLGIGVAVVCLTAAIGRRLAGDPGGLLAAAFLGGQGVIVGYFATGTYHTVAASILLARAGSALTVRPPSMLIATVRDNITYGREGIAEAEVVRAARVANAHDFIQEFPDGYETVVGDRGIRLSGGQRQRIAIGRTVVGRPPILILDEARSSLDSESERLVQQAIDRAVQGATPVVIAHRRSAVLHADKIVVLGRGGIEAVGRHADLLAGNETYGRLYGLQFAEAGALGDL